MCAVYHIQWMNHHRFLEVIALFETNNFQLRAFRQEFHCRDLDWDIGLLVGWQSFVFQIFAERIHVVGTYAKDIQSLYVPKATRKVAGIVAAVQF